MNQKKKNGPQSWAKEGAKNLPVRIATWNTRTLREKDSTELLLHEIGEMQINVIGITETHWTSDIPPMWEQNGYVIIHSSREDGIHRQGVATIIKKETAENLVSYDCISSRLMTATFQWNTNEVTTFFTVYAPDSSYDDVEVDNFYDELQIEINRLPRKNNIVILGDFNASVGEDTYSDWPEVVGKYGFGQHNQRGLQLLQFCAINELIISNTNF